MPKSPAERVAALIDEVSRVERDSEGAYLALGRLLPAIVEEMELSSRNATNSLKGFASLTGGGSASSLSAMAVFAEESSAYFKSIHGRDSAFLARINDSIARLSTLEDIIGRVRSDSEEMEIISLNAMTVALKSGTAGKAFSVITDELKRLSSRTIALTEAITGRGRDLMSCFSGLRDSLKELDDFQEGFFGTLDTTLTKGYQVLDSNIRDAVESLSRLLEEATEVREPVQAVMQGIQLQDIIRQSLQHVTISLREAEEVAREADCCWDGEPGPGSQSEECRAGRDEDLAFVASIAELAASLLQDVVDQLDSGAEAFSTQIMSIRQIVEGVETRRRGFISSFGGGKAASDSGNFAHGTTRYLELKKKVIQTSRRLSEQVKELDESFRGLAGLLSRFQNIVVASRIEVAKNRSLSGVANTVQGMVLLTDRIGSDVGEAMDTTKDFIRVAYTAIADYAGGEGLGRASGRESSETDRLQATLLKVEGDLESLDRSKRGLGDALEAFQLYTPAFLSLLTKARDQLEVMAGFSTQLGLLRDESLALRASVAAMAGSDPSATSIRNERLRSMIEKFTIFTHKRTAGEIGSFEVEEGVGAGEITLF